MQRQKSRFGISTQELAWVRAWCDYYIIYLGIKACSKDTPYVTNIYQWIGELHIRWSGWRRPSWFWRTVYAAQNLSGIPNSIVNFLQYPLAISSHTPWLYTSMSQFLPTPAVCGDCYRSRYWYNPQERRYHSCYGPTCNSLLTTKNLRLSQILSKSGTIQTISFTFNQ